MTTLRPVMDKNDPIIFLIGTGLAIAGSIALLGPKPLLVAAAPFAVAVAVYAMRRPLVTLLILVVSEVLNLAGIVALHAQLPVFPASLALGALTIGIALRSPECRAKINRWTAYFAGLVCIYLGTQAIAILGSVDNQESMWTFRRILLDCVFLLIVLMLAQLSERPWVMVAAIVLPLAVLSLLALVNQVVFSGTMSFGGFSTVTEASGELTTTLRYGGPLPDSNFWGRNLVMGMPLACALLTRSLRRNDRIATALWGGSAVALLIGVYLTQSRGTFLAAAVGVLVWIVASGPAVRRWSLVAVPFLALVLVIPGVGNRLSALVNDVFAADVDYGIDPSILGRKAAQEIAWAMFDDRPMYGFGPGTYYTRVPEYAGTVETAVVHPTDAPHNLYAQLAAETGIVGLLGWLIMVGGVVAVVILRMGSVTSGNRRTLLAAALAAVIAWSAASIFLHLAYFRSFALVIALAAFLASTGGPVKARALVRGRRTAVVVCGSLGVGVVVAGTVLWSTASHDTTANQQLMLLPRGDSGDTYFGYALDIRSRTPVLPTYSAIMRSADSPATVAADPVRGVITISLTDADAATAETRLRSAVEEARERVRAVGADDEYSIVNVGNPYETSHTEHSVTSVLLALVLGAGAAGATAAVLRRVRRRPAGEVRPGEQDLVGAQR